MRRLGELYRWVSIALIGLALVLCTQSWVKFSDAAALSMKTSLQLAGGSEYVLEEALEELSRARWDEDAPLTVEDAKRAVKTMVNIIEKGGISPIDMQSMTFLAIKMMPEIEELEAEGISSADGLSAAIQAWVSTAVFFAMLAAAVETIIVHLLKKKSKGVVVPVLFGVYGGWMIWQVLSFWNGAMDEALSGAGTYLGGMEELFKMSPTIWPFLAVICLAVSSVLWGLYCKQPGRTAGRAGTGTMRGAEVNGSAGGATWICPGCGNRINASYQFCTKCGQRKPDLSIKYCTYCHSPLSPTAKFCPHCSRPTSVSGGVSGGASRMGTYSAAPSGRTPYSGTTSTETPPLGAGRLTGRGLDASGNAGVGPRRDGGAGRETDPSDFFTSGDL